jgi:hypothetical protein
MVVVRSGRGARLTPPPPSSRVHARQTTLSGFGEDDELERATLPFIRVESVSLPIPSRPRPVTLIESVDDELAARYRVEAQLILSRMLASAAPVEHPLLRFVREIGRQIAFMLRLATS